jgi:pyruvate formate lyase activating enzyme
LQIRGLQKISLVDYPGEVCSTVFVGGCNLRCRFCFNRDLVLDPEGQPTFSEDEVFGFLKKRMGVQGALCITGGEPALQEDLAAFIARAKALGLKVKLDTNGTFPEVFGLLLREGTLDYVAMDVKAPAEKYDLLAGKKVDYAKVEQTIFLLRNSSVEHEFRTTVVPGLLEERDLVRIAKNLQGSRQYVLQQFRPVATVLDESLTAQRPFTREEIEKVALMCRPFVENVLLRGF